MFEGFYDLQSKAVGLVRPAAHAFRIDGAATAWYALHVSGWELTSVFVDHVRTLHLSYLVDFVRISRVEGSLKLVLRRFHAEVAVAFKAFGARRDEGVVVFHIVARLPSQVELKRLVVSHVVGGSADEVCVCTVSLYASAAL